MADQQYELTIELPASTTQAVFGQYDTYARKIEKAFGVSLLTRDNAVKVTGHPDHVEEAGKVIAQLASLADKGKALDEQSVNYAISLGMEHISFQMTDMDEHVICHTLAGKPITPKTIGQENYIKSIRDHMITFGLGPAGTGKTYLAMAMGITAFKNHEVDRIILTRPAIEAGENLGFLPGDLQSKVDPYLRPLYDALYEIMGPDNFLKNTERGLIEVAPLAYMRGRTLDRAFIILDEAQNTTPAQMKMFLTRIGFGSKVVVTGDMTQKDLPAGAVSGLTVAVRVIKKIPEIEVCELTSRDVVRHPLVQRIVDAYERYESSTGGKLYDSKHRGNRSRHSS